MSKRKQTKQIDLVSGENRVYPEVKVNEDDTVTLTLSQYSEKLPPLTKRSEVTATDIVTINFKNADAAETILYYFQKATNKLKDIEAAKQQLLKARQTAS